MWVEEEKEEGSEWYHLRALLNCGHFLYTTVKLLGIQVFFRRLLKNPFLSNVAQITTL